MRSVKLIGMVFWVLVSFSASVSWADCDEANNGDTPKYLNSVIEARLSIEAYLVREDIDFGDVEVVSISFSEAYSILKESMLIHHICGKRIATNALLLKTALG